MIKYFERKRLSKDKNKSESGLTMKREKNQKIRLNIVNLEKAIFTQNYNFNISSEKIRSHLLKFFNRTTFNIGKDYRIVLEDWNFNEDKEQKKITIEFNKLYLERKYSLKRSGVYRISIKFSDFKENVKKIRKSKATIVDMVEGDYLVTPVKNKRKVHIHESLKIKQVSLSKYFTPEKEIKKETSLFQNRKYKKGNGVITRKENKKEKDPRSYIENLKKKYVEEKGYLTPKKEKETQNFRIDSSCLGVLKNKKGEYLLRDLDTPMEYKILGFNLIDSSRPPKEGKNQKTLDPKRFDTAYRIRKYRLFNPNKIPKLKEFDTSFSVQINKMYVVEFTTKILNKNTKIYRLGVKIKSTDQLCYGTNKFYMREDIEREPDVYRNYNEIVMKMKKRNRFLKNYPIKREQMELPKSIRNNIDEEFLGKRKDTSNKIDQNDMRLMCNQKKILGSQDSFYGIRNKIFRRRKVIKIE